MLFFYAEGTEHCRTKGQTGFPPHQRAGVPADYGAGALVAARGARRPWGGRAYHSPRDAPTMGRVRLLRPEGRANHGRARLLRPEGRADHGAGGLIEARGTRRPWGGCAYCVPRGAPTMGRARLLQPEGRADHGRAGLLQPEGCADHGRARLLQPEGRADHGRAGLSQPEGRADYGRARLLQRRRGRTCRNFFPIVSFGKLYEASNPKRGSAGRAGKPGAQQGIQDVCKAKAWQSGRVIF